MRIYIYIYIYIYVCVCVCVCVCVHVCHLFLPLHLQNKHQTQSLNYLLDKKVSVPKFHGPYAHP